MSDDTFTPGPWKWINYPDGRKLLAAPSQAVIHCPDAPITLDEPDARLIAAAPDLLAALKAHQRFQREGGNITEVMAQAEAALAKAEGGPR